MALCPLAPGRNWGTPSARPIEVDRAFPVEAACPLAEDEEAAARTPAGEHEKPDDWEKFCSDMERLGRSFADTLAGLYLGLYDSELKAVAAKENQMQTLQAMDDANVPHLLRNRSGDHAHCFDNHTVGHRHWWCRQ